MFRITEVVKHILIINVILYFVTHTFASNLYPYLVLNNPFTDAFKPYQIVTSIFMHADMRHIFFNMFAVFMFGTALEAYWGPKRFLVFYLVTGIGAMIFHFLVWYLEIQIAYGDNPLYLEAALHSPNGVLGASGAVFGLLVGYGMLFPNRQIMLLIPPIPIKAKYFVTFYAVFELIAGITNSMSGIAHFAHVGGAVIGVAMILYWRYKRT